LGEKKWGNLQTLYDHYFSGSSFNRVDWLNCVESLGLLDEAYLTKLEVDTIFSNLKDKGNTGINFKQFCSALGAIAQRTHPGEEENQKDNSLTKCLERLLFEIMGGIDDVPAEFDPNLNDSYLEGLEETEEEKATRIAEEKAAKKARRQAKKKRDKEAKLKAEEEARIEVEEYRLAMEKIEEARKKAASRVNKRKKEKFRISVEDTEKLIVYYEYFKISPGGMSRGDWLNCQSTLGIIDDNIVQKVDCENIFDELCTRKTRGLSLEEFGVGVSLLAMQLYSNQQLNQSEALIQLLKSLIDEDT